MNMTIILSAARTKAAAVTLVHARELEVDQRRSAIKTHDDVRLLVKIVMADAVSVQLTDQLIQEVKEVLRQRLSERQSSAIDPLTEKDIPFSRHQALASGGSRAFIHDSAGHTAQAFELLERALLPPRQKPSHHPGERKTSP